MVVSPIAGFLLGYTIMGLLFALLSTLGDRGPLKHAMRPRTVNAVFGKIQILSSSAMGISHGLNDAQKTMGIIALALAGATAAGSLDGVPQWLSFLRIPELADHGFTIPVWIKAVCALVMAAGTMAGGWRIIRTLGHKMVKLQPMNGVAADIASSTVIITASTLGIPVSTTHNVSSAIMGVGAAKRANAIKWTVVERMVWAWILTLPIAGALAWVLVQALRAIGLASAPHSECPHPLPQPEEGNIRTYRRRSKSPAPCDRRASRARRSRDRARPRTETRTAGFRTDAETASRRDR
jgi:PiT family inorganic phosphate transporter